MTSRDLPCLHTETRIALDASSSSEIVDIALPGIDSWGRASHNHNARRISAKDKAQDESTFRANNCATASGVYHRRHHKSPKSFLWRVLDKDFVLSIRALDIVRQKRAGEAGLVLNLRFAQPIRRSCIAFADPVDQDVLSIFVVDRSNYLYTITLRPDAFRKRPVPQVGFDEDCSIQASSTLSVKVPHRLVAANNDLLIATLFDGGNVRFNRNMNFDINSGSSSASSQALWKETPYSSKGWTQNIRSLLGGGNTTIRYEGMNMELSAALSTATTDFGLGQDNYLFTACVDHRLRIWSLATGQILEVKDLLDAERNPQDVGKWTIDPSQSNLIRLAGSEHASRICVTYSPLGAGAFKFWRVEVDQAGYITTRDLFPILNLVSKSPSSGDVWTLADFAVDYDDAAPTFQVWVMWKNNMAYRTQYISFRREELEEAWRDGWFDVHAENVVLTAPTPGPVDPTDATEKWLSLILAPGRFTRPTLDTALSIFEQGLGMSKEVASRNTKGLAESICNALTASATLDSQASTSGATKYEKFRNQTETQWRRFYRLLIELDKQRGEALALSLDPDANLLWVVCADNLSAVRECSHLERLCHNPSSLNSQGPIASLISTGLTFLDSFSDAMLQTCTAVLRVELFDESSKTDGDRIQFFAEKAAFWRHLSEEDCNQVIDALGSNFKVVTSELYQELVSLINAAGPHNKPRHDKIPVTVLGKKVQVSTISEMAELLWRVCLSQLILLVHMECEFDRPEDALHNRVDIGSVFRYLVRCLKRLELIRWQARTEITVSSTPPGFSNADLDSSSPSIPVDENAIITVLEGNVQHLLNLPDGGDIAKGVTDVARNICAPDSGLQLPPHLAQCSLLVRGRADLARELSPLAKGGCFAGYVQGRVALALGDVQEAAGWFRRVAVGLSIKLPNPDKYSCGLLSESDWDLLYSGLPRYYLHIAILFSPASSSSSSSFSSTPSSTHVVEFARLAWQFVDAQPPSAQEPDIRAKVLNQLFTASVTVAQFNTAHAALFAMRNRAHQVGFLRVMINKLCDQMHNGELMRLPFPGLEADVDAILEGKCRASRDVLTGTPYHQILYAWRVRQNDFRGAAAMLMDRVVKLKTLGEAVDAVVAGAGGDALDTPLTRAYLALINTLCCVDKRQAWVVVEPVSEDVVVVGGGNGNGKEGSGRVSEKGKRKVVTLADVRREYQEELDRIAAIENNQFGFVEGDEMDVL